MEKRITELEIKFAHQDDFIFQMNQIVADQQKRIEKLECELLEQRQRLEGLSGGSDALSPDNSKPPHY